MTHSALDYRIISWQRTVERNLWGVNLIWLHFYSGGGGLAAGVGAYLKTVGAQKTKIIGVEPEVSMLAVQWKQAIR